MINLLALLLANIIGKIRGGFTAIIVVDAINAFVRNALRTTDSSQERILNSTESVITVIRKWSMPK